jgi:hypothetical protein
LLNVLSDRCLPAPVLGAKVHGAAGLAALAERRDGYRIGLQTT